MDGDSFVSGAHTIDDTGSRHTEIPPQKTLRMIDNRHVRTVGAYKTLQILCFSVYPIVLFSPNIFSKIHKKTT